MRTPKTIAIARLFRALQYPSLPSRQEADSDKVQKVLRYVRPSHAPLRIDAVHLVDVTADPEDKTIAWEHLERIPLGG